MTDPAKTAPISTTAHATGLVLLIVSERQHLVKVLPERAVLVVGRAADCDVPFDDPALSRRHARLTVGDAIELEDLGSSNGTFVRGERVPKGERRRLEPGEGFQLGSAAASVNRRAAALEAPRPATTVARSEAVEAVYATAEKIADGKVSVLITGETGVGKDVLAQWIHARSKRAQGPYVRLNSAAVSESLIESELFGHEKGAFTGAGTARAGLIEAANGGTLFLDEIGELGPALQAKLLRVLEAGELTRVGATQPRPVDVRFISATHRDLKAEAARGTFRQDLYYRLGAVVLHLPALRERLEELEPLARELAAGAAAQLGLPPPVLGPGVVDRLLAHGWPGNVRELKNAMERAVLLCRGGPLLPEHLPQDWAPPAAAAATAAATIDTEDRQRIVEALEKCAGNQTQAAKLLGISRRTLVYKLGLYGLPRPRR